MRLNAIWVYLADQPLLWLALTVTLFWLARRLYLAVGGLALCNPVLVSIAAIVGLLLLSGTDYQTYFDGAQFIHFLLGPATVALAVPLVQQLPVLRRSLAPLSLALLVGALTGILSTVALCWLLGVDARTLLALLPRSITTPIAMGVSEQIGASAELTVVFVVITGVLGAAFGVPLLGRLMRKDPVAGGFALGVTSHGIGTARAFEVNAQAGAFAGLGMGLNGALTAILIPLLVWLLGL
ncbi:LrgB family protein [Comamonas sp. NLF-1-9]|uniref:LrgB family protein n=1 Tax=Comamonas sp. NLF-1-9 TaxID=2853163 RepID=UPI001C47BED5|nr:LrgB family protein [Comamonas sp. NLF-1-9]QXL83796.1 LrgB family protein [Comamonas sp. NLF-1-9]